MSVTKEVFGTAKDGRTVTAYSIKNEDGSMIRLIDYGAILQSVLVPDKDGKMRDAALGYDTVEPYETNPCYFGATIGRNGNRISGAAFSINGKQYRMTPNENGCNNLHSGPDGFEKRIWSAETGTDSVRFTLHSKDGDQGFPGEADFAVTYSFTEDHVIRIHYEGTCDQDTVMNLTNHSYWNLNGEGNGLINDHGLKINASAFTAVDAKSIPTGSIVPVEGTPFDFREMKKIGRDAGQSCEQLKNTGGYDHNFVLDHQHEGLRSAACAQSDESGISLEVLTDQPGLQFYAGNFISGPKGKQGHEYAVHSGFALESQHYPDSVNQPDFEKPIVRAGEKYDTVTCYVFRSALHIG
ncbi:MAG: galactose mutarotase [Lachnospiraceae bacterium]|jgi:aldose 1-epimerase|nr:galactose mutarotase [Lachnospiraceae bacterium]MCI1726801.1 galactose mutarotase [Lachnospiraceae bacterium]